MNLEESIKGFENKELEKVIEEFKKNSIQENYNNVFKTLFTNIEQDLILPSKLRKDNNGFDLKSIYDENDKWYLVAYTSYKFVTESDESFLIMKLEGIIRKILEDEPCSGLIINPDKEIDSSNAKNQFLIPKEYIIKLYRDE